MAIKTSFGWKDIDTMIMGVIPTFITEISYKTTHPKENSYGRGNQVVRRGRGNKGYEVSLTLGMEEMVQIEQAVRAKYGDDYDPTDVAPFDIPITYDNGEQFVADIIENFEFTEWGRASSQGDTSIDVQLPGVCSKIRFNVAL